MISLGLVAFISSDSAGASAGERWPTKVPWPTWRQILPSASSTARA